MPQRLNPSSPLSTPLVSVPSSLDFATRTANILAKKINKPVFVGCSATFGEFGAHSLEEEVEALKKAVGIVVEEVGRSEGSVESTGTGERGGGKGS